MIVLAISGFSTASRSVGSAPISVAWIVSFDVSMPERDILVDLEEIDRIVAHWL
ncbi:hypothetical protein [Bradyrhizobium jicamae]|nr:hypothetical protein [Bradyrhizobium jicamae]